MAYLSLVLFSLACFAGDVVELEPVKAVSFSCSSLTAATCQTSPFCHLQSGNCIDDPCIIKENRVLANDTDTCDLAGSVQCRRQTITGITGHDCTSTTPDTGILCVSTQYDKVFDYCAYAYIRDQKCPDSICETTTTGFGCVRHTQSGCQQLNEKDCALVPKCYWRSNTCLQDPCFDGSEGKNCATWTGTGIPTPSDVPAAGDCLDFKPLKSGTTDIQIYCVYKNNKNPNICYFAGKNSTSVTDYGQTYPTYNFGDTLPIQNPTCTGTINTCEGTGDCYTTINTGGALAGRYCTDGTHGNASILRIPSMLVFLIVSALSLFIL